MSLAFTVKTVNEAFIFSAIDRKQNVQHFFRAM